MYVWFQIKKSVYFTIFFFNIYRSYYIFLVLFIGSIILFQLTFKFTYCTFQQKFFNFNKISEFQIDSKREKLVNWSKLWSASESF